MQEDITVVILTFKRPESLKLCLESLFRDIVSRKNIEVLVINNGDDIQTKEIFARYPVRVIQDATKSKGYLRNLGWKNTQSGIIAYLDDDTEVRPGWLNSISELFSKDKSIAGATGPCIVKGEQLMIGMYEKTKKNKLLRFLFNFYDRVVYKGHFLEVGRYLNNGSYSIGGSLEKSAFLTGILEIDIMSSCNMAVRREVFEALAGFDENFIYNHEDGDLSLRLKKAGYKLVFNPKMSLMHYVNPAKNTRTSAYFMARDFGHFYRRHLNIKNFRDLLGFSLNILLLNFYWFVQVFRNAKPEPIFGVCGLFKGLSIR